ncbi:triphosphoribosyl-dephospho-CoA synthase [Streptomyces sp. NPDC058664]|uniref:triphosphoribosyl-dephospho-CoA synthase n=1 Tax=unclassified Streptomyces TaxID=2593676 RepID=UPI0036524401
MRPHDRTQLLASVREALPALHDRRARGASGTTAQIDTMLSPIATLDDSRVRSAHGPLALRMIQRDAGRILAAGGSGTDEDAAGLRELDELTHHYDIRPVAGGALMSALLFLDQAS